MTVGIPGAGIGGLFYLASALWMPVQESWNAVRGKSTPKRRALVARQFLLTVGVLTAMGCTAWLIETVLSMMSWWTNPQDLPRILTYSALWIGLGTLTTVYLSTHLARLVVGRGGGK